MARFHFSYDLKKNSNLDHDDINTNLVDLLQDEFDADNIVKPVASTVLFNTDKPYTEVKDEIENIFGEDLFYVLSEVAYYKGDTVRRLKQKANIDVKDNFKNDYL